MTQAITFTDHATKLFEARQEFSTKPFRSVTLISIGSSAISSASALIFSDVDVFSAVGLKNGFKHSKRAFLSLELQHQQDLPSGASCEDCSMSFQGGSTPARNSY